MMLLPNHLKRGDHVGVIAPAGPPNQKNLRQALPFLEALGLQVKFGQFIDSNYGYLAGSDRERLDDLHMMIKDPHIRGIFFARGGYGTGRIIADLDYQLIKENPKVIWGYSDITYLHTAMRQKTGLVTFHGPMVATDMADERFDKKTKNMFNQLFTPTELHYTEEYSPLYSIVEGYAKGQIVGGNLSLLISTLGTPYEIDMKNKLLLIEDIGEAPYRVDSMLNQLKLSGKLHEVAGVMIGDFAKGGTGDKPSLTLAEVFTHYFSELNCPVMSGFKIGHCFPHFALPLGVEGTLDTVNKTLVIDPGVK